MAGGMGKQITNIVFTKNRPLQLDGYLRSLYKHFPQKLLQTYILYKPELFGEQYEQLFQKFPDCKVIEEKDFSSDFLSILNKADTKYILFGVDDVVYFDSVDFDVLDETFKQFSKDIFGFSLRHSPQNAKACEAAEKVFADNQKVYKMNWQAIKEYPFELCATIYRTELIKSIIYNAQNNNPIIKKLFSPSSRFIKLLGKSKFKRNILKYFGYFYAPNPLESWNCRWCQNHVSQLPPYLYYQKLCASAIQVNMVNTSTSNKSDDLDEHTVESLAEKYSQNYRLDIDYVVSDRPTHSHCGAESLKLIKPED
jgi:hypothetical protein